MTFTVPAILDNVHRLLCCGKYNTKNNNTMCDIDLPIARAIAEENAIV